MKRKRLGSGDFLLVLLMAALVMFGIIMVFSASYYSAISDYGDPYYYLKKEIMWAVLGICLMAFTTVLNYKVYAKLAPLVLGASIVLLILLFTPLGITANNATRWLGFKGFPITLMPGEIAKIAAIIFVARFLSEDQTRIKSFKKGILPLFILCGIYGGLIIKQPNLSTAITVCGIIIGMMFVAGMSWLYMGGMMGAGAACVMFLVKSGMFEHWAERLTSFLDPFANASDSGYQVVQSLLALGSGGFIGKGLGKSVQKNLYLPEPQNDFILAVIGEELGYIGCIVLLLVYLLLIWRCIRVALNAPDQFSALLASGISIMIALQVILNVAVVTSSMPATGVALPFVSYGGNSLMIFMGSIGILLNISRHSQATNKVIR